MPIPATDDVDQLDMGGLEAYHAVMDHKDANQRFDRLLEAMFPPSERKKPSTGQASDAEHDAYCGDIQTRPDTSEDASH